MQLSDPRSSRVVLVGVGRYRSLPQLPTAVANLDALRDVFTDPALWGLPPENCVVLADPSAPSMVDAALRGPGPATVRPDGLLLFYFAGHGLIDPRTGSLHLAVGDTDPDGVYATSAPYEWVRRAFLDAPAGRRVVILDCCYAGRAIDGMGPAAVIDETEIDLTCVLVAASATRAALAPADEPYTAFTGTLVELLRGGLPDGPELLDLGTVYQETRATQLRKGRPLPELRARNGGELIPLVRNAAPLSRPSPVPLYRRTPREPRPGLVITGTAALPDADLSGTTLAVLAYDPEQGALGIRLGRPVARPAADILGTALARALPGVELFDGGPVRDVLVLLVELAVDPSIVPWFRPILGNLGTLPPDVRPDIAARVVRRAWAFLGYVGWRPGQLEHEIAQGGFTVATRTLRQWLGLPAGPQATTGPSGRTRKDAGGN
ncbi:hypothetical protein Val02_43890 [Virgisporangium aliadipatigenens]|uniref:Peptidase C14 caspase domain-containing protein n=1 Tax=Virgisporangium aliadipatigenens TaxID=741659 RepID=A0A8J4DS56_9ACTN|nr:YqgE/AlgH family protein [Virgisporangium aliadipatigenens]GIJ47503.1 hypothetical protein Val02_43890 [Virgisporangium aliadipatigenens]